MAYAEELVARLPRVAPDLGFATFVRATHLDANEQIALPLRLARARPRLVHHLSVYAPIVGFAPTIVTIHDLIHLRFPEMFKNRVGPYYATVVRALCRRAARVITDDERTIEDLERFLGVPSSKVAVIPLGVDDRYLAAAAAARVGVDITAAPTTEAPYFLFVGNHRTHKDIPTLLAAWASLPEHYHVDVRLTGIDDLGPEVSRPERSRGEITFVGHVDAPKLVALYAGALALVHPALCEGFGLPLVEAAAMGTPVIACRDAIPSVIIHRAAIFEPRDVAGARAHMIAVLDGRVPRGSAQTIARNLTWDLCAERTAEVYRTVLEDRPNR
jgi:glycosyltransferase involved in cell wall biosynthesis